MLILFFFFFFFYIHLTLHSPSGMAGGLICTPTQGTNYTKSYRKEKERKGERIETKLPGPHSRRTQAQHIPNFTPYPTPPITLSRATKKLPPYLKRPSCPLPLPQYTATSSGCTTPPMTSSSMVVYHSSPRNQRPGWHKSPIPPRTVCRRSPRPLSPSAIPLRPSCLPAAESTSGLPSYSSELPT